MAEWERYVRAFRRELDAWAVWEPGSPVDICDYGVVDDGRWRKLGSLWELVQKNERDVPEESGPTDLQFGSASVSAIEAGVSTPKAVGASVKLSFSSQDSLYVRAYRSTQRTVANLQNIAERMLSLEKRWREDWFLVAGVRTADSFSVLASSQAGGEINVTAPLPELQSFLLGAAKAGAALHISGTVGFSYIGRSGPIHVDLVRVRRRLWGDADIRRFGKEQGLKEDALIEDVRPSDFFDEPETHGR